MIYFEDSLEVLTLAEVPESTNTYKAVDNTYLHDTALKTIQEAGFDIKRFYFKSNRAGTQVIGIYELDCKDDLFDGMIAWRNSYDKSKSVAIVTGSTVNICGNGAIVGEMLFIRKHTGNILDIIESVFKEQIDKVEQTVVDSRILFNLFSVRDISNWFRNAALGNLFMKDILSVQQLSMVKNQYLNPTYDYGFPGTLWELFNHCTFALKKTHPTRFFEVHQKLREYLENI